MQGALLDEKDPCLNIGEVVASGNFHVPVDGADAPFRDPLFCPPSNKLRSLLLTEYATTPLDPAEIDGLELREGFWWLWDCLFVPLQLLLQVLMDFHDLAVAGHPGSLHTLDLITWTVSWLGVRKDVLHYVKSCFSCQRAKHSNQHQPGLMTPLSVPS